MSRRRNSLHELAARLVAVQKAARSLGVFTGNRGLLECHKCGLLEDVISTGQLITCRSTSLGRDTGLRFQELSRNRFHCPVCRVTIQQKDRD